jgi:hypothetical protein
VQSTGLNDSRKKSKTLLRLGLDLTGLLRPFPSRSQLESRTCRQLKKKKTAIERGIIPSNNI